MIIRMLFIYLILTFVGPLYLLIRGHIDFHADYRTANRDSAHIAPDPLTTDEAIIQAYSARTFNWRGLFAVHTWIAVKPKGATHYIVYHVIGWRLFRNLPPLLVAQDIPDRYWFNQRPEIILDIRGARAEQLIPLIAKAATTYPYPNEYRYWPGPNSNTFTAYIGRQIPELQLVMPSDAVGKDYLGSHQFFANAVSGTGYQFSLFGLVAITLAKKEGLEINLLGVVYGVSLSQRCIKLPGLGDITWP